MTNTRIKPSHCWQQGPSLLLQAYLHDCVCKEKATGEQVLLKSIKMIFSVSPVQSTSPVHQSSPLVQSSDCRQSVKSRGKEEMSLGTRLLRDKTMSPLRLRNFEEGAPPPPTGNEAWSRGRRFRFELGFESSQLMEDSSQKRAHLSDAVMYTTPGTQLLSCTYTNLVQWFKRRSALEGLGTKLFACGSACTVP